MGTADCNIDEPDYDADYKKLRQTDKVKITLRAWLESILFAIALLAMCGWMAQRDYQAQNQALAQENARLKQTKERTCIIKQNADTFYYPHCKVIDEQFANINNGS